MTSILAAQVTGSTWCQAPSGALSLGAAALWQVTNTFCLSVLMLGAPLHASVRSISWDHTRLFPATSSKAECIPLSSTQNHFFPPDPMGNWYLPLSVPAALDHWGLLFASRHLFHVGLIPKCLVSSARNFVSRCWWSKVECLLYSFWSLSNLFSHLCHDSRGLAPTAST